ncbi:MAG: hybrid sensor histidine kinase/response regulator [Pseudolabrys sp.]|nr:hybrid sensor histidine kinase/response regulator [Pseudolabrys sp.]
MISIKSVLLVEDNSGDARLLREMFKEQDAHESELTHVASMAEAEAFLAKSTVDLILLDLGLPDAQGMDAIRRTRAIAPGVPLVVMTGLDDDALAAQALQEGSQDYLVKGQIEARGLLRAMRYAQERKRLERLKDDFVASVSHELRTPLTSICASLSLLVNNAGGDIPGPAARLIAIAHVNSQRLVRLINDILDIEKMEAGQMPFRQERVELRPLLLQAIEANREFAETCGVRLRMINAAVVDDVKADADRMTQVITNLLSNAIKFSPAGAEVDVAVANDAGTVRLSVRDRGPGIPEDFKARIFERFAQADTSDSRPRGGTGLGLSIVKQIVGRLGGEVGFADAPGGGTVFHVTLPAWGAAKPVVGAELIPDGLQVLLCDDDPQAAAVLEKELQTIVRAAN